MNRHACVDESYRRNYLQCAVVVNANDVRAIRGTLVSMLRKNQRRIHMAKENRASKKIIVNRISTLPITTIMVSAAMSGRSRRSARNITLTSLTELLHEHGVTRVIIESCGQDHEDRQVIGDRLAQLSALGALDLHHLRPSEDALLWLPDIVAWVHGNPGTEWVEARRSLSITELAI